MADLRQRRPIVKRRRQQTRAQRRLEAEHREAFKKLVLALDRHRCIGSTVFAAQHRCEGPLQAHHTIRQQIIRTHISTLELSEEEILDWLWHPGLGATVCEGLHSGHTTRMKVIPLEWLPGRCLDFAEDRAVAHLLRREHPPDFPTSGEGWPE